jgi:hypothetical protein
MILGGGLVYVGTNRLFGKDHRAPAAPIRRVSRHRRAWRSSGPLHLLRGEGRCISSIRPLELWSELGFAKWQETFVGTTDFAIKGLYAFWLAFDEGS